MSKIQWTDKTWNPTSGCTRISKGCDNCYIVRTPPFRMAGRRFNGVGVGSATTLEFHEERLDHPRRWRKPQKVFVNSLSDLFHVGVPLDFVRKVFDVMQDTPRHTYQVLTKRASRLPRLADKLTWPDNLWMGTSVEDAEEAHRVDSLRQVPVAIRWISAEPLLGPLDDLDLTGISWVVIGGESGPIYRPHPHNPPDREGYARPMDLNWVLSLIAQCRASGTAVFVKQLGSVWADRHGADSHGGDPDYWPDDLRIREFPVSPVQEGLFA